jgi:hypothetical protein
MPISDRGQKKKAKTPGLNPQVGFNPLENPPRARIFEAYVVDVAQGSSETRHP